MVTVHSPLLIHGDCLEELAKLPGESVDLIFADPPYWMRVEGSLQRVEGSDFDGCDDDWDQFQSTQSYLQFTTAWLAACHRVLKPNGSIWVIGGMQCIYTIGAAMQELGYWFLNDVVWHKKNPTPNFKGTRLNNSHETLIWATKSQTSRPTFNYHTAKELNDDAVSAEEWAKGVRKQLGSVWRFAVCSGNERLKNDAGEKLHTTQKPRQLLERVIALTSKAGDVVLDPFGGTMTTAAVARSLGRAPITIERSAKYYRHGCARVLAELPAYDDLSRADYDVKLPRVPLQTLIDEGYLSAGQPVVIKRARKSSLGSEATLLATGKLSYNGQSTDFHAAAGLASSGSARQNGWDWWGIETEQGWVALDHWRQRYRREILGVVAYTDRSPHRIQQVLHRSQVTERNLDLAFEQHLPQLLQHAGLRVHSGEDGLYRVEDRHGERWIIGTPGPRKIYPQEKLWLLTSMYTIASNVHRQEQPLWDEMLLEDAFIRLGHLDVLLVFLSWVDNTLAPRLEKFTQEYQ